MSLPTVGSVRKWRTVGKIKSQPRFNEITEVDEEWSLDTI
jgi:hypothetical protein